MELQISLDGKLLFKYDINEKTSGRIMLSKKLPDGDYLNIEIVKNSWTKLFDIIDKTVNRC